ncbi:phosphotransferase [Pseudonocardia sp. RS010]|uniref:phosphotransferase family protein n=1 Tax=Pseudonocardia sp. RS010 TaxID=3385979 RepID=UPI0039A35C02
MVEQPTSSNPPSHLLRTRSRYAANAVFDALVDPAVGVPPDVPWRPQALTPDWLTAALCAETPGAAVESVTVVEGDQGSSYRRKVSVTYNAEGDRAGLPRNLFTKSAPTWLTRMASSADIAKAESTFLLDLRKGLDIEAPTLLFGAVDEASGRMIELFVDEVESAGARFFDRTTTISRTQAEQMVDTLATLHGTFAASVDQYSWLPEYGRRILRGDRNGLRAAHEQAMDRCADLLPADLYRRRDEIWPGVVDAVRLHGGTGRTVLHSDVHLGNWYETGAGRVGLADWQCVCRGHWARDVAYTFASTLATEDRRRWERDLLERYIEGSTARSGVEVPIDEAWRCYRQQLVTALLSWTPTLVPTTTMPDMQPEEMSVLMIERIGAAMDDLDALGALGEG